LCIISKDIQVAGSVQLCTGQPSRGETAVHATREAFNSDSEEMLLIVPTNAFNSLNRAVALYNIQWLCPFFFYTVLINPYHQPACLFIDGDILYSKEGTTLGDPLTML